MNSLFSGFQGIMFPIVCACCGTQLPSGGRSLCDFCLTDRFEAADSSFGEMTAEILPDYLAFRTALWQFDKSGYLRDLLHNLKYRHTGVLGVDFGLELGKVIRDRVFTSGLSALQPVLVPVPLHKRDERRRGYNQAAVLCQGISRSTNWGTIKASCVVRTRKTRTQTGLSPDARQKNVSGAFSVSVSFLSCELPVVVDDVYTTGSTVLELAYVLRQAGARKVGIATLAEA